MGMINDGYIMLLDEVRFNNKTLGHIAQEGVDWGGEDPTYNKLYAAQIRTAPVKKVITSAGAQIFSFQMIQLVAQNMADVAGGKVIGEKWEAPSEIIILEGAFEFKSGTGQTVKVKRASLTAQVRGKLGTSGNLYMDCKVEMLAPADGSSPYSIEPTVPGITVDKEALNFAKAGGTQVVYMSASGAITMSGAYAGFTVKQDGNYLVIDAANNATSAPKNGMLTLTLIDDAQKKVNIALTQAG